jgi:hypothetical protein
MQNQVRHHPHEDIAIVITHHHIITIEVAAVEKGMMTIVVVIIIDIVDLPLLHIKVMIIIAVIERVVVVVIMIVMTVIEVAQIRIDVVDDHFCCKKKVSFQKITNKKLQNPIS